VNDHGTSSFAFLLTGNPETVNNATLSYILDDDELKAQTGLEIEIDDSPGLNLKRR
jgi:Flp pilus assembly protein TadD